MTSTFHAGARGGYKQKPVKRAWTKIMAERGDTFGGAGEILQYREERIVQPAQVMRWVRWTPSFYVLSTCSDDGGAW